MRFGDRKHANRGTGAYKVAPLNATEQGKRCVTVGCMDAPAVRVDQLDVRCANWPAQFTCCWRHLHDFLADFRRQLDAGRQS